MFEVNAINVKEIDGLRLSVRQRLGLGLGLGQTLILHAD